jgi:translation elongation factor EF-Ts
MKTYIELTDEELKDLTAHLREETGQGIMICKKGLIVSDGDIEAAKRYILKFDMSGMLVDYR